MFLLEICQSIIFRPNERYRCSIEEFHYFVDSIFIVLINNQLNIFIATVEKQGLVVAILLLSVEIRNHHVI